MSSNSTVKADPIGNLIPASFHWEEGVELLRTLLHHQIETFMGVQTRRTVPALVFCRELLPHEDPTPETILDRNREILGQLVSYSVEATQNPDLVVSTSFVVQLAKIEAVAKGWEIPAQQLFEVALTHACALRVVHSGVSDAFPAFSKLPLYLVNNTIVEIEDQKNELSVNEAFAIETIAWLLTLEQFLALGNDEDVPGPRFHIGVMNRISDQQNPLFQGWTKFGGLRFPLLKEAFQNLRNAKPTPFFVSAWVELKAEQPLCS